MPEPIVTLDEGAARDELRELVRKTVEETLNALLEEKAAYQRYTAHFCRNVLAKVPKAKRQRVASGQAVHSVKVFPGSGATPVAPVVSHRPTSPSPRRAGGRSAPYPRRDGHRRDHSAADDRAVTMLLVFPIRKRLAVSDRI